MAVSYGYYRVNRRQLTFGIVYLAATVGRNF